MTCSCTFFHSFPKSLSASKNLKCSSLVQRPILYAPFIFWARGPPTTALWDFFTLIDSCWSKLSSSKCFDLGSEKFNMKIKNSNKEEDKGKVKQMQNPLTIFQRLLTFGLPAPLLDFHLLLWALLHLIWFIGSILSLCTHNWLLWLILVQKCWGWHMSQRTWSSLNVVHKVNTMLSLEIGASLHQSLERPALCRHCLPQQRVGWGLFTLVVVKGCLY